MTEQLNIYQKIADVKANIEGFTKDTKVTTIHMLVDLKCYTESEIR